MDGGQSLYFLGDLITVFAGGLRVTLSFSIVSPRDNGGISMASSGGRRRACSRSTRRDALVTGQEVLTRGLQELSASSAEPGSSEKALGLRGEAVFTCSLGGGVPQADAGRLPGTRQAGWGGTDELRPSACSVYLSSVICGTCPNHIVSVHL